LLLLLPPLLLTQLTPPLSLRYGFTECAVALSAAGADVNRTDMNGLTPLHMCVQNNQKDTALLLVTDLMADYDIKNNEGMAALEYVERTLLRHCYDCCYYYF